MAGLDQDSWSSERIRRDPRLNERHYGCVQGEFKADEHLQELYGKDTIREGGAREVDFHR